jgi:hypothetical protein
VTGEDIETAALIELTDDLQDAADSEPNVVGGGCLTVALLILGAICLAKILS